MHSRRVGGNSAESIGDCNDQLSLLLVGSCAVQQAETAKQVTGTFHGSFDPLRACFLVAKGKELLSFRGGIVANAFGLMR
jgi:hypothetical protein